VTDGTPVGRASRGAVYSVRQHRTAPGDEGLRGPVGCLSADVDAVERRTRGQVTARGPPGAAGRRQRTPARGGPPRLPARVVERQERVESHRAGVTGVRVDRAALRAPS